MQQAQWQEQSHFEPCGDAVLTDYKENQHVYFSNCHADQPSWLRSFFKVKGVIRRRLIDKRNNRIAYELFMLRGLKKKIVYQEQLTQNGELLRTSPWGHFVSSVRDGLMIQLNESAQASDIVDEVVDAMALDYQHHLRHKRPIHVLLKSKKAVVRVSYDGHASFKLFGKKADYQQAIDALKA